jgi:hypothetical protein
MTNKQRQPETEAGVKSRRCYSCDKSDSEAVLLTIILPPVIMERQELCPPCLKVAIDDSKKKGKAAQHNDI